MLVKNNFFKFLMAFSFMLFLTGCGSKMQVATPEEIEQSKQFSLPQSGEAGVYIYRYTSGNFGVAINREVFIDDEPVAILRQKQYVYKVLEPGEHKFSVQSEFGKNDLNITMEEKQNYFVRQYIKLGVFAGSSNIEQVEPKKAMEQLKGDDFELVK